MFSFCTFVREVGNRTYKDYQEAVETKYDLDGKEKWDMKEMGLHELIVLYRSE